MLAVIAEGRLRWTGHVRRELGYRLSWRISESEPQETRRETQKERLKKSKVVSIHATMACMGSRGIAPFILKPQH
jgi:hypothetical protein